MCLSSAHCSFYFLFQIVCHPKFVLGTWRSPVGVGHVMDNRVLRDLGCCDTRSLESHLYKLLYKAASVILSRWPHRFLYL